MASREELESALAGLKKEAGAVTSQLKAAKRRTAAVQRQWVLPPIVRRASVAAYIAGGYAVEPAVQYLVAYGRQRHWPDRCVGELGELVHDLVLATSDDDIAELAALDGLPDVGAFAPALSYAREWRTVVHARRLNEQSGLAPSTAQLLTHAEAFGRDLPDAARPRALGSASAARARAWTYRLRRRWGGRLGRPRVKEAVPTDEKRDKARRAATACPAQGSKTGAYFVPIFGNAWRAHKRGRIRCLYRPALCGNARRSRNGNAMRAQFGHIFLDKWSPRGTLEGNGDVAMVQLRGTLSAARQAGSAGQFG
jgi:hypothetical protein